MSSYKIIVLFLLNLSSITGLLTNDNGKEKSLPFPVQFFLEIVVSFLDRISSNDTILLRMS